MQKRIIRKIELTNLLSQIASIPFPKIDFEQYTIPVNVAATVLHLASHIHGDIIGKRILDLGCGTGRLALGAAFLGAKKAVGVDIDKNAVKLAFNNSIKLNLKEKVAWIAADINVVCGTFDTVLQNPPFGVQNRKADRKFLQKALESAKTIYSLHKHPRNTQSIVQRQLKKTNIIQVSPAPFLMKFVEQNGGNIANVYAMTMTIPRIFPFHTKREHKFIVDLYLIHRKDR